MGETVGLQGRKSKLNDEMNAEVARIALEDMTVKEHQPPQPERFKRLHVMPCGHDCNVVRYRMFYCSSTALQFRIVTFR
jgi:hypothetical protein